METANKVPNGRKFRLACYTVMAAVAGLAAAVFVPGAGEYLGTFLTGISGILAVYCGGNVGNKWVLTRPDAQIVTEEEVPVETEEAHED